jgi:hypothetical protein
MVQRREQHDHNDDRNNEKIVKIGVHDVRASQAYRYNEIIAIPDIVTTSFDCRRKYGGKRQIADRLERIEGGDT